MALTASSRFNYVRILFGFGVIDSVDYQTTDNDFGRIGLRYDYPASGSQDRTDLEILQEINESADGFRDADGNSVDVELSGVRNFEDIEDLEPNGYPNPLATNGYQRWETKQKIEGALQADGSFERDSTTGVPTIGLEGKFETKGRKRDGSTFDSPLSDWTIAFTSDEYIRVELAIPSADEIDADDLDDYTPIRTMLAWLESKRTAGSAVGSDASNPDTILGGTRRYTFAQASGDTDIVVRYFTGYVVEGSDDNIRLYIIDLLRVSGAAIDTAKLEDLLESETVSLSNTDNDKEEGEVGGYETIVKAKSLDFGAFGLEPTLNGLIVSGTDINNKAFSYPILAPRTVTFDTLPNHATESTKKTIPRVWLFDTIHLEANSTKTLRLPNPSELIPQQGSHRTIAFHNVSTSGIFIIEDWDGTTLIALNNKEYAKFQITLEGGGNGGKILGIDIPPRRFEYAYSTTDNESGRNFANANVTIWDDGAIDLDLRTLPFVNSSIVYRDIDTYFQGTSDPLGANQGDIHDEDIWGFRGFVEMGFSGILTMEMNVRLYVDEDAVGTFGWYNRIRMYRMPADGSDPVIFGGVSGDEIAVGESAPYQTTRTTRVNDGDHVALLLGYYPDNVNCAWAHLRAIQHDWFMTMLPHIERSWEA